MYTYVTEGNENKSDCCCLLGGVGNDDRHWIRGFPGDASQRKVTILSGFSELTIPPVQNK